MKMTKHAEQRMWERLGIRGKAAEKTAGRAYSRGLRHSELAGNLKKWVDGMYLKHRKGNQIRLYGDKAYIFHNDVLVTVVQIPHNLAREARKALGKQETEAGE